MPSRSASSPLVCGLLLALFAQATLSAPTARAEPTRPEIAAAKRLFAEAADDEANAQWASAIEKLTRVLAIKETAGVRFHVALCRERVGQLVAAASDYRRAAELAESMSTSDGKAIAEKAVAALVDLGHRIPTLTVQLAASSAAAQVAINGRRLEPSELGQPEALNPGEVNVEAVLSGKKAFRRSLILVEGNTETLAIALEPEDPPPAPPPAPVSAGPPPPAPPPPAERSVRPATLVSGGATALLAGVAIGFGVKHGQLQAQTDSACADPTVVCDVKRGERLHQYSTYALLSAAGAVVGAGLTVYFALSPATPSSPSLGLSVAPAGAAVFGRFLLPTPRPRPRSPRRPAERARFGGCGGASWGYRSAANRGVDCAPWRQS